MSIDISSLINQYSESLKEEGWIQSEAVEAAFRRVPRHLLIEKVYSGGFEPPPDVREIDPANPEHLAMIYSNRAICISWDPEPSSSSEPGLAALMLELSTLQPGMRVLEIGAGSGYNAALMAELVSDPSLITTLDLNRDLVERTRQRLAVAGYGAIHILAQDGFYGCETNAPYDRIVATVGCSDLSPYWLAQLASDGFMLIPLSHGGNSHCPLVRVEKDRERIIGRVVRYSNFMPIRGGEFSQDLWSLSSIEAEMKLYRQIQPVKPEIEYPLFPELKALLDPTPPISDELAGIYEFHYFLALHRRDTFIGWEDTTGLGNEQSCVLLNKNGIIQLYGERAPALYQELESIYQQWVELGKPRMLDYKLEFIPLSATSAPKQDFGSNTWTIDRKFFRQIVRL
jgi:protein-L-isoaspartate(D-aspartate) O-methyltransferase